MESEDEDLQDAHFFAQKNTEVEKNEGLFQEINTKKKKKLTTQEFIKSQIQEKKEKRRRKE